MTGDAVSRRGLLRAGGTAVLGALLAGCSNDDDGSDFDPDAWADVDEIALEGVTQGWEGIAPAVIEGETNPTLGLRDGREYDVTWVNGDGAPHNLEIRDDGGDPLESTDGLAEEGEQTRLTLAADAAVTRYVCQYHETQMVGDVAVFTE